MNDKPHIRVAVQAAGRRINDRGAAGRTLCGAPVTDRDILITDKRGDWTICEKCDAIASRMGRTK